MNKDKDKFYWQAQSSSGGTLSVRVALEKGLSKTKKESALAQALKECYEHMKDRGYVNPEDAILSSSDIAQKYGHTRQYWEKLLNQGKILYRETAAGRITTDLWINGYINNKEGVDRYVRNVNITLLDIKKLNKESGRIKCSVCDEESFDFFASTIGNINGICRVCGFQVNSFIDG